MFEFTQLWSFVLLSNQNKGKMMNKNAIVLKSKKKLKSKEIKFVKKYGGYCEVTREGTNVTSVLLGEKEQQYYTKLARQRANSNRIKSCVKCGMQYKWNIHTCMKGV
jgi:hypothetical protein